MLYSKVCNIHDEVGETNYEPAQYWSSKRFLTAGDKAQREAEEYVMLSLCFCMEE